MTGSSRTARLTSATNVARIVVAGAIVGPCAVVLAAGASASPCDPATLAMTPQPQLSCPGPAAAPPPVAPAVAGPVDDAPAPPPAEGAPVPVPVGVPANPVAGPRPPAFPAPGEAPFVPPVVGEDGAPTQSFGQGGFLMDIWHEFHNGVPSDLIYAPPPADPGLPPPAP